MLGHVIKKPKIILTRRWPGAVEDALQEDFEVILNKSDRELNAFELRQALQTADAVLPTVTDKIDAEVFDCGRLRTKILANFGVGYSHIDIDVAKEHGVTVTNTPEVLSECSADLTLTLMLMVARRAGEGERQLKSNNWSGWSPTHMMGTRMSGKSLGIIGFGRIGQEVAKRAHFGFGMRIIVHNRSAISKKILATCNAKIVDTIDALLPKADFVSLHCPGGKENKHLIDARRLNLMRPTAYLINTARGEVVDEQMLANALRINTIAGAGLDVYEREPVVTPELLKCENAVLLPHLGSATRETREAMGFRVLENLEKFFSGETPIDLVV